MFISCFSQSLVNLLITGKAVSNVWDNDKDLSGLSKCSLHWHDVTVICYLSCCGTENLTGLSHWRWLHQFLHVVVIYEIWLYHEIGVLILWIDYHLIMYFLHLKIWSLLETLKQFCKSDCKLVVKSMRIILLEQEYYLKLYQQWFNRIMNLVSSIHKIYLYDNNNAYVFNKVPLLGGAIQRCSTVIHWLMSVKN